MPTSDKKRINKIISDKKADVKYQLLTRAQIQQLIQFHRAAVSKQAISNFFRKEYAITCTTQEVQRFFERLELDTTDWDFRVRRKMTHKQTTFRQGVELSSPLKLLLEGLENKNCPR